MWGSALLLAAAAGLPIGAGHAASPGWYPSPYGAADTIGAANNLSPGIVRNAARLIRTGKVYSLGMDIGIAALNGKPFPSRSYEMHVEELHQSGVTIHDDWVKMWLGNFGSQMDGLGHVGIGELFYNGNRDGDFYGADGLKKLAVSDIPPIVSRGVLLDFAAYYGVDRLPPEKALNKKDIEAVARRQKITLRRGDVVLIRTGWLDYLIADPGRYAHQPGLGREGARYLASIGVVAVGSDNHGIDVQPAEPGVYPPLPGAPLPVHLILLVENGVYLLEDIKTDDLARDKAYEFLFVLGQPKLVGGAQVVINPIAIR